MYYDSGTCFSGLDSLAENLREQNGKGLMGWVVYVKGFILVGVDEGKRFIDRYLTANIDRV